MRDKFFYQKKKLKNCGKKYYINEDLTKQDSKIFRKARQEVKEGVLSACWTKGGVTWAKSTPEGKPFIVPL
jgi:5-bromo-4-chloroindolyl phosphate hydrolysis protein